MECIILCEMDTELKQKQIFRNTNWHMHTYAYTSVFHAVTHRHCDSFYPVNCMSSPNILLSVLSKPYLLIKNTFFFFSNFSLTTKPQQICGRLLECNYSIPQHQSLFFLDGSHRLQMPMYWGWFFPSATSSYLAGRSSIFSGCLRAVKWQCSAYIAWETDLPGWYFNQCFDFSMHFMQRIPTNKHVWSLDFLKDTLLLAVKVLCLNVLLRFTGFCGHKSRVQGFLHLCIEGQWRPCN